MINQDLKDWVDEKPNYRSVDINYGKGVDGLKVFAATFEFDELVGCYITDTKFITATLVEEQGRRDREKYETLKAKFGNAA